MKIIIVILFLTCLTCLIGCGDNVRTADQIQDAYYLCKTHNPSFISLLHYRGTDSKYHYFNYRSMDDFVLIRIKKEEIDLPDERPPIAASAKPFPGYYAVDPLYGFKRVDPNRKSRSPHVSEW